MQFDLEKMDLSFVFRVGVSSCAPECVFIAVSGVPRERGVRGPVK